MAKKPKRTALKFSRINSVAAIPAKKMGYILQPVHLSRVLDLGKVPDGCYSHDGFGVYLPKRTRGMKFRVEYELLDVVTL